MLMATMKSGRLISKVNMAATRKTTLGKSGSTGIGPVHDQEDYASAARLFRALSHPLRVQLVCGLISQPQTQTGISRLLGLNQPLVAQHLAVLRQAGIVRGTRRGGEVVLEVADDRLPGIFAAVCQSGPHGLSMDWAEIARQHKGRARKSG
jgi:ArsR family transcriptional regulator, zinc-responsive transcriptional repressor